MTFNEEEMSLVVKIDTSEKKWDKSYILRLKIINEDGLASKAYTLTLKVINSAPKPELQLPVDEKLLHYLEEMKQLQEYNSRLNDLELSGFWKPPGPETKGKRKLSLEVNDMTVNA